MSIAKISVIKFQKSCIILPDILISPGLESQRRGVATLADQANRPWADSFYLLLKTPLYFLTATAMRAACLVRLLTGASSSLTRFTFSTV